jgi:hypothetical protein
LQALDLAFTALDFLHPRLELLFQAFARLVGRRGFAVDALRIDIAHFQVGGARGACHQQQHQQRIKTNGMKSHTRHPWCLLVHVQR